MSRAIEAAALFTVGVIAGGALVYTTRKSPPPPPSPPATRQPPHPPTFRKDALMGEIMSEGASRQTHRDRS